MGGTRALAGRPYRSTWIVAAALLVAAAGAAPAAVAGAPVRPRPPRLAVVIVVDGLSWAHLERYRPWLVAGLGRMLGEGEVFRECRYRHINTETGPGHASLATGAPPRVHGIVTNTWLERRADGSTRSVYCASEPAPANGSPGVAAPGPDRLRVATLGDRLVASVAGARVVSIAGKDRAALLLAGRDRSHAVYWLDRVSGTFVTSPVYDASRGAGAAAAALVGRFNAAEGGDRLLERFGGVWRRLPPPANGERLPQPAPADRLAGYQVPVTGLFFDHDLTGNRSGNRAFPAAPDASRAERLAARRSYLNGVYASPINDALVADLAVAVIDSAEVGLGRDQRPDLLALSFSANDPVSHDYGPDSEEALDVLRRLDVQLGRVLAALDARVGRGRYVVALSADHGFTPIPEYERIWNGGAGGGRIVDGSRTPVTMIARLNRALDEELCLDPTLHPLAANQGWSLYYDRAVLPATRVAGPCGDAGIAVTAADLDAALPRVALRLYREELEGVVAGGDAARWRTDARTAEMVGNDLDPARSGDAWLIPRPGVILSEDPRRGTTHGSQNEADVHVPLVFVGAPFPPGASDEPAAPYDLAPTLAAVLGVELPAATGCSLLPAPGS